MGIYFNPGNEKFREAIQSEIYIDKTELIQYTNASMFTLKKNICISRPRRFGKSMAANMLAAYYSRGCDSQEIFAKYKIGKHKDFKEKINRYDTIFINMQEFLSQSDNCNAMLDLLKKSLLWELLEEYPDFRYFDHTNLVRTMQDIYQNTKRPFVVIIDEWDCIFREYKYQKESQEKYLDFLRDLLKDKGYIHLAYMTGILPIKKYGTHSALNMFDEFSMLDAGPLASYVGFTEKEVDELCHKYKVDMAEMKNWYDGYAFEECGSIYSPRSVVSCINYGKFGSYWNQTENFEALRFYVEMNFEGLRDDILRMIAGESVSIIVGSFSNDMVTFHTKDDVLTLLVHLGYLAYNYDMKQVYIPNNEVRGEFVNCVAVSDWGDISKALKESADTLHAIWEGREKQVALCVEHAHFETSQLQYHDENALSYTISLALYAARNYYTIYRELPSGKGFADMVFIPKKKFADKPALIVELKWNKSATGAIQQIKNKEYCQSLSEYKGNMLLVGINYNRDTKEHECIIEEWKK